MLSEAAAPMARPRLSRKRHRSRRQEQGNEGWLKTTPEFSWKLHDVQAEKTCMSLGAQSFVSLMQLTWFPSPS
jgi:hypothetical protein